MLIGDARRPIHQHDAAEAGDRIQIAFEVEKEASKKAKQRPKSVMR